MRVTSSITVVLEFHANAEVLNDGNIAITKAGLGSSGVPGNGDVAFLYLPDAVRTLALNTLASDAKNFVGDMNNDPLGGAARALS